MSAAGDAPVLLWAVPRSRSTALVRVMIERGDLEICHEPFSAIAAGDRYHLGADRFGSVVDLLAALVQRSRAGRRVFVKDTTDYRYDALVADPRFRHEVVNTFLIRAPEPVAASHYAVNPEVTLDELGFRRLYGMFEVVREATGAPPVVVDGDDLVADPRGIVDAYCDRVGLARNHAALQWRPGPRPEWARTAAWHREVSASRSLVRTDPRYPATVHNTPRLAWLAAHHRPYYQVLARHKLAPATGARTGPAAGGEESG